MDYETKKRARHDLAVADRGVNGDFAGRQNFDTELELLESAGWTIVAPEVRAKLLQVHADMLRIYRRDENDAQSGAALIMLDDVLDILNIEHESGFES